jgi:hypothetical protein
MVMWTSAVNDTVMKEISAFADTAINTFKEEYKNKPIPQFIQDMIRVGIINSTIHFYRLAYNRGAKDKTLSIMERLGLVIQSDVDENTFIKTY